MSPPPKGVKRWVPRASLCVLQGSGLRWGELNILVFTTSSPLARVILDLTSENTVLGDLLLAQRGFTIPLLIPVEHS